MAEEDYILIGIAIASTLSSPRMVSEPISVGTGSAAMP